MCLKILIKSKIKILNAYDQIIGFTEAFSEILHQWNWNKKCLFSKHVWFSNGRRMTIFDHRDTKVWRIKIHFFFFLNNLSFVNVFFFFSKNCTYCKVACLIPLEFHSYRPIKFEGLLNEMSWLGNGKIKCSGKQFFQISIQL